MRKQIFLLASQGILIALGRTRFIKLVQHNSVSIYDTNTTQAMIDGAPKHNTTSMTQIKTSYKQDSSNSDNHRINVSYKI